LGAHELTTGRRADAIANRDAIVSAARALYGERGADVPFDDIAQAAAVGRATLYRHFPTREDLHLAVLDRVVADVEAAAADLPETPTALLTLLETAVKIQAANLPIAELLPPQAHHPGVTALRARMRAAFREPLARAQAAGLVRTELTPEDVRIQLVMLSAIVRPERSKADQRRAWALTQAALGITP
jgi:AcrR family transcriptional regulator